MWTSISLLTYFWIPRTQLCTYWTFSSGGSRIFRKGEREPQWRGCQPITLANLDGEVGGGRVYASLVSLPRILQCWYNTVDRPSPPNPPFLKLSVSSTSSTYDTYQVFSSQLGDICWGDTVDKWSSSFRFRDAQSQRNLRYKEVNSVNSCRLFFWRKPGTRIVVNKALKIPHWVQSE